MWKRRRVKETTATRGAATDRSLQSHVAMARTGVVDVETAPGKRNHRYQGRRHRKKKIVGHNFFFSFLKEVVEIKQNRNGNDRFVSET